LISFQLKVPPLITGEQIRYEKWIKEETRLDTRAGSRTQVARPQESTRKENCKDSKAHRGRDTAKGFQHRRFAGFSRLTS
jgi:hypothetical protein